MKKIEFYTTEQLTKLYNYAFRGVNLSELSYKDLIYRKYSLIFVLIVETGMNISEIEHFTWKALTDIMNDDFIVHASNGNIYDLKNCYVISTTIGANSAMQKIVELEEYLLNSPNYLGCTEYVAQIPLLGTATDTLLELYFKYITNEISIPNYGVNSLRETYIILTITYYHEKFQSLRQRFNFKNLVSVLKKYLPCIDDNMFNLSNEFMTHNPSVPPSLCDFKMNYNFLDFEILLHDFKKYIDSKGEISELLSDFFDKFPPEF